MPSSENTISNWMRHRDIKLAEFLVKYCLLKSDIFHISAIIFYLLYSWTYFRTKFTKLENFS